MKIYLAKTSEPWFYRVKKTDEVYNLNGNKFSVENFAKKFNFEVSDFENLNGKIKKIEYGDVLIIPPSSKYAHIVQPTETLSSIAEKYGTTVQEIKNRNNINQIFIGLKLFL